MAPKRRPRAFQERFGRHLASKSVLISIFNRFLSILGWFRDRFLGEKCEEKVRKNKAIFGVFFEPFSLLVVFSVVALVL